MSRLIGIVFARVNRVGVDLDEPPTQLTEGEKPP
jgi:hypothetical protein